MATTVTPATLSVTLTENYLLDGVRYGNSRVKTIASQGEVDQRVMSISTKGELATAWTTILALDAVDAQGQVVKADYAYFRITNLDDTNNLNLRLYNGADYLYFSITPLDSFMLLSPDVDATTSTGVVTFANIEAIVGQSNSATEDIDIEYLIVTA